MKFAAFACVACVSVVAVTAMAIDQAEIEYRSGLVVSEKCVATTVYNLKDVAAQWISDVRACKVILNNEEQKAMDSMHKIVEAANNVTQVYEESCKGGQHLGDDCANEMKLSVIDFVLSVVDAGYAITGIIESPRETGACAWNATYGVGERFKELPKNIEECIRPPL